jgi:hemerythrin
MLLFHWSSEYSVQNQEMDRQHQELLRIINELYAAIQAENGGSVVGDTIGSLVAYAHTHFAAEERLMEAKGYPDFQAHKAIHDKLLARVEAYDRRYRNGDATVASEMLPFLLGDWLTNHISVIDRQYASYLGD